MKKLHAGQNAKNVFWPGGKICIQEYVSAKFASWTTGSELHA
jgi:hypothetical protein